MDYGWRLSMYLAGWLSVSGTAEDPLPDPSDCAADAACFAGRGFTSIDALNLSESSCCKLWPV